MHKTNCNSLTQIVFARLSSFLLLFYFSAKRNLKSTLSLGGPLQQAENKLVDSKDSSVTNRKEIAKSFAVVTSQAGDYVTAN